jgi:hypothetical protein
MGKVGVDVWGEEVMLVVPRKTSFTPIHAHVGLPSMFSPHDEDIQISCVFTEDLPLAKEMRDAWWHWGCSVIMGGPAFDDPGGEFEPGCYLKQGITITSRGCIRECPWCYVPKREGKIRELQIKSGNIIQDNNILACSRSHQTSVIEMLKTQSAIDFKGGLDPRLLTDWFIEQVRGLKIHELWLSADHSDYEHVSESAIKRLVSAGFSRNQIRCFVMIGYNETMSQAEERLRRIYHAGALPFAQVFDQIHDSTWRKFARKWQRAAITKYINEEHDDSQTQIEWR